MPNEERMTLSERKRYLRLIKTRHLTASTADLGPQIANIKCKSDEGVGERGAQIHGPWSC